MPEVLCLASTRQVMSVQGALAAARAAGASQMIAAEPAGSPNQGYDGAGPCGASRPHRARVWTGAQRRRHRASAELGYHRHDASLQLSGRQRLRSGTAVPCGHLHQWLPGMLHCSVMLSNILPLGNQPVS